MRVLMGCDGGGTKTLCALATPEGEVLSTGVGGPSNLCTHWGSARQSVREAFEAAAARLDSPPEVSVACLALAGYHACAAPEGPEAAMRGVLGPAVEVRVISDMEGAFLAAAGGEPGVVVIAGTGSAIYGGNAAGARARAAGWGYLLDDEGSAFWIGLQALRAAMRHHDGRGPQTQLTEALLRRLDLPDPEGIERYVFSLPHPTTPIAALAPVVVETAKAGDPTARGLLAEAGAHLAEGAWAVLRRLDLLHEPSRVSCVGSVLAQADGPVRRAMAGELERRAPLALLGDPLLPPVGGALVAAAQAAGAAPAPDLLDRLRESLAVSPS